MARMAHSPAAGNPVARWMADDSFRPRPPDLAVFRYKGMIWILPFFGLIAVAVGFGTLFGFKGADVAGHVIVPVACWAVATVEWLIIVGTAVRIPAGVPVVPHILAPHLP